MQEKPIKILSLFARGKEIGFVIIEGGEILRYGVKTVKGKRNRPDFAKRVEKTIAPLLEIIDPKGLVVIERCSDVSKRGALCEAIGKISKLWKERGYILRFISLSEAKKRICGSRKATYRELIEVVVEEYPILRILSLNSKLKKTKYWQKVLIAMALAEGVKRKSTKP